MSRKKRIAVVAGSAVAAATPMVALAQPAGATTTSTTGRTANTWSITASDGSVHECVIEILANFPVSTQLDVETNALGDAVCVQADAFVGVTYLNTDGTRVTQPLQTDGLPSVQRTITDIRPQGTGSWSTSGQVVFKAPCASNCTTSIFTGPQGK